MTALTVMVLTEKREDFKSIVLWSSCGGANSLPMQVSTMGTRGIGEYMVLIHLYILSVKVN